MKEITSKIIINAPRELVWQIVLDFDAYHEWNPFTPKVECSLIQGEKVILHVDMNQNSKLMIQEETLLWVKEQESIAWGITSRFPVKTERAQILSALGPEQTEYFTYDKFWGMLVPVVMLLYKKKIQRGFDLVAVGLKKRAEELYVNSL